MPASDFAAERFAAGETLWRQQKWNDAIQEYTLVLVLDHENVSARIRRSQCYGAIDKHFEALADAEYVWSRNPENIDASIARAFAIDGLGRHDEALAAARLLLGRKDRAGECAVARLLIRRGEYQNAVNLTLHALNDAMNDNVRSELHDQCGLAYAGLGEWEDAFAQVDDAIAVAPDDLEARLGRATCNLHLGKGAAALFDVNQVLAVQTGNVQAKVVHAEANFLILNIDDAVREIDAVAQSARPPTTPAELRRTLLEEAIDRFCDMEGANAKREEWKEVLADFDEVIGKLTSRFDSAWLRGQRARARVATGNYLGAIDDFTHCIALEPQVDDYWQRRASCYQHLGKYEQAISDYAKATGLNPANTRSARNLASCLAIAGRWDSAIKWFEQAANTSGGSEPYPVLLLTAARLRLGAPEPLVSLRDNLPRWSEIWPATIGQFLVGEISEDALLQSATSADDQANRAGHLCEACYYAAMIHEARGDLSGAKARFHQCVATGKSNFTEYQIGAAELRRLETPQSTKDGAGLASEHQTQP